MPQSKWLKTGAAALLSIGMLAACGDDDRPRMEQEQERDMIPEEEDGTEIEED